MALDFMADNHIHAKEISVRLIRANKRSVWKCNKTRENC